MTRWCLPASEPLSKTGDNVGMAQAGSGPPFSREPGQQGRLLRVGVTELPDRHMRCRTRSRGQYTCPIPPALSMAPERIRSEEHTSELQSHSDLVCRLLLEKKKQTVTKEIKKTQKQTKTN